MKTEAVSKFLDNFSALIRKEKESFTENFFKDKQPETMTFLERKNMYADYRNKWKEKEDKIYKAIN